MKLDSLCRERKSSEFHARNDYGNDQQYTSKFVGFLHHEETGPHKVQFPTY